MPKIYLDNMEYQLTINKTRNRGISLKFYFPNEIIANANYRLTNDFIINQIFQNKDKIIKKFLKLIEQANKLKFEYLLSDQKIWLFGKLYEIIFSKDYKEIFIEESKIYIPVNLKTNKKYLTTIRQENIKYLQDMFNEILFRKFNNQFEVNLDFKNYRSRWGVCFHHLQKIILNTRLIHLPPNLIEVVIIHEIIHLIVPNHSRKFYLELYKYLPNYRYNKQQLNHYHMLLDKRY